jgi:cellulose biosynthesis protein BcsQ
MTLPENWRMPPTIVPMNLKGGVGKTAVAEGLAGALHKATGQPVLMADANTEGGLTRWATAGPPRRFQKNLGSALLGHHPVLDAVIDLGSPAVEEDPAKVWRRTQWSGQHLIPTTTWPIRVSHMAMDENSLTFVSLRLLIQRAMREAAEHGIFYAAAIVDPGHNDTDATLLAMVSGDLTVPVVCARQSQSVDQLDALFTLFEQARKHEDHRHMRMGGIIVTDHDRREYMPNQVVRAVANAYGLPETPENKNDFYARTNERFWGVTPHRAAVERAINSGQTYYTYGNEIEGVPQLFDSIVRDRILGTR